jgi:phage terminase small subunit
MVIARRKKISVRKERTDKLTGLTMKEKIFCENYIYDWNATRSYLTAYPTIINHNSAGVLAHRLLRKVKVQKYIEQIQDNLEKTAGISRMKILNEHMKLAFSSIADMHNTWIKRKDFESLTNDQRACIAEIDTKVKTEYEYNSETKEKEPIAVEYIRIKLYDKQKALDSISKMLGYDAPVKTELTGKDGKPLIPPARILTKKEAKELLNKLEDEY